MAPHPGITMHKIPVQGMAGLLYVAGTVAVFLLALPKLAPLAAAGVAGGALLAPALYRWRVRSLTSLRGGSLLFVAAFALFFALGTGAFRTLAAVALVMGALFAEILLRHAPQHPSISARLVR